MALAFQPSPKYSEGPALSIMLCTPAWLSCATIFPTIPVDCFCQLHKFGYVFLPTDASHSHVGFADIRNVEMPFDDESELSFSKVMVELHDLRSDDPSFI